MDELGHWKAKMRTLGQGSSARTNFKSLFPFHISLRWSRRCDVSNIE